METYIRLRNYQRDIIEKTSDLFKQGLKRVLIQSPTGSGKSILIAFMIKSAIDKNMQVLFVVHRFELISQISNTLKNFSIDHDIITGRLKTGYSEKCTLLSVGSFKNAKGKIKNPDFVIHDEASHITSETWSKIFSEYPNSYSVMLTATPERLDGSGLGRFAQKMITGPSISELISAGYLSKYKYYAPNNIDTKKIRIKMGDYSKTEVVEVIEKSKIIGSIVNEYKKLADNRQMIIFAPSIEISKKTVDQFNMENISAEHIDGKTPIKKRDNTIKLFEQGKIKILSNVELFIEGLNIVGIEAIGMLRPTMSLALYLQMVGRALRPSDKHAIILDHVGNYKRHGLPDDSREWSLDSRRRKRRDAEKITPTRVCMECFSVSRPATSCEYCGAIYPIKNLQIENVDGKLTEIIKTEKRREVGKAKTLAELIQIGRERGYKNPTYWARMVLRGRK